MGSEWVGKVKNIEQPCFCQDNTMSPSELMSGKSQGRILPKRPPAAECASFGVRRSYSTLSFLRIDYVCQS